MKLKGPLKKGISSSYDCQLFYKLSMLWGELPFLLNKSTYCIYIQMYQFGQHISVDVFPAPGVLSAMDHSHNMRQASFIIVIICLIVHSSARMYVHFLHFTVLPKGLPK
jgi:hypothetical protein